MSFGSEHSAFDRKAPRKTRINGRIFFGNARYGSATGATFQLGPKRRQGFGGSDGIDFYPAVRQILSESCQAQTVRGAAREKSETHALHRPTHKVSGRFAGRGTFAHMQPPA
jgi:hypothetical protein